MAMKVEIYSNFQTFRKDVHLVDKQNNATVYIGYDEKGNLAQEVFKFGEGPKLKPLISANSDIVEDVIKAIADYAHDNDIKTENENLLKGKLEATEKHLQDLQKAYNLLLKGIESDL